MPMLSCNRQTLSVVWTAVNLCCLWLLSLTRGKFYSKPTCAHQFKTWYNHNHCSVSALPASSFKNESHPSLRFIQFCSKWVGSNLSQTPIACLGHCSSHKEQDLKLCSGTWRSLWSSRVQMSLCSASDCSKPQGPREETQGCGELATKVVWGREQASFRTPEWHREPHTNAGTYTQ